jgi:hypothetical protein
LAQQVVLDKDVLGTETLDLAHGLAVIPELVFDGRLDEGILGGIFAFPEQAAAAKDFEEALNSYAELFGPHLMKDAP